MKSDFSTRNKIHPAEAHASEHAHRNGTEDSNRGENGEAPSTEMQPFRVRPADVRSYETPPGRYYTEEEPEGLDLRQLLAMLRRRRKILLAVFLTIVATGALWTWLSRPVYQATATLLVNTSSPNDRSMLEVAFLTDLVQGTRTRSQETQIEILKSAPVLEGALRRLSPEDKKSIAGFSDTTVTPLRDTDVIAVSVFSHSPKAAAALANALCEEYIEQSKQRNRRQVRTAAQYVSGRLADVGKDLTRARAILRDYKRRNNIYDIQVESNAQVTQLAQIEADRRQARTEKEGLVAQLSQLRSQAAAMPGSIIAQEVTVPRPTTVALRQELTRLELELLGRRKEYSPGSEQIQNLQSQIADVKQRLRLEAQTAVGGTTRQINPVRQNMVQEIAKAQSQIWALEARGTALEAAARQMQARLKQLPTREFDLNQLNTKLITLQQTHNTLSSQYMTLKITEQSSMENASIMANAGALLSPVRPQKARNMMTAIVLGLMLAFALAALAERLDDRVHSEEDAESASRLPVLAHIPFIKEKEKQSLIGHDISQTSALLESYRMLRTNIEFSSLDEPVRSLVITSSQPNEGKSTTSADLAIAMALDGKKVILVDADLRRPSIDRLFELPNRVGLTSVVAGTATLEEALQETKMPGLLVMTSGPKPPNPPELLNSKASRALFAQIVQRADFVVIDTPPALVMADAQIAASIADASLLVISLKEAGKREIARTSELIAQTGTKVLGAVLNKLTDEVGGYYGYDGYKNRYYGNYLASNEEPLAEPQTAPAAPAAQVAPAAQAALDGENQGSETQLEKRQA